MRRQLELSNDVAAELAGAHDTVLKALEETLHCQVYLRGNLLTLDGSDEAVEAAAGAVTELARLVGAGHELNEGTIAAVTQALDRSESPGEILDDVVWRHRNMRVAPKTLNQKRYVDSIRSNTITFGIGPAGTGKTFLAVAMAALALSRREVNRIILTRPAVEAGERLGFLPGDLREKVDPYLRPLFDALHDMLDPERVAQHLERGVIEIAPLAFMRGRAQPVNRQVMTPDGPRAIGSLRVGDLVAGSDGRPTPVLGVYPQGRREVFRVSTQDGASTLACAEHLWTVKTPEDRRRGKPGRTLQTQEMVGRLRRNHQHRYELPVVSAPVEFEPRDVPLDPYALGLLLSDVLPPKEGLSLLRRQRTPTGAPPPMSDGGVLVADPVTDVLRDLGLAATDSASTFIPEEYLLNATDVRVAVLQGLLDGDGEPGAQQGIKLTTASERLGNDVAFLVQSLGGVVARDRDGAFDIRLPAGLEPFRLTRKRAAYEAEGGGRPMRFIDRIEPAGEAETVCIQVAAEDSLYVTDDFLVTHNTLNDAFIILDEAQNTSPEQMKMILTRLGFGSRMVVTGDITQIDLPREQSSGLVVISDILEGLEGIDFVRFGGEDVVRHKLVQAIVAAYNEHAQRAAPELRPASKRRA